MEERGGTSYTDRVALCAVVRVCVCSAGVHIGEGQQCSRADCLCDERPHDSECVCVKGGRGEEGRGDEKGNMLTVHANMCSTTEELHNGGRGNGAGRWWGGMYR